MYKLMKDAKELKEIAEVIKIASEADNTFDRQIALARASRMVAEMALDKLEEVKDYDNGLGQQYNIPDRV